MSPLGAVGCFMGWSAEVVSRQVTQGDGRLFPGGVRRGEAVSPETGLQRALRPGELPMRRNFTCFAFDDKTAVAAGLYSLLPRDVPGQQRQRAQGRTC